jgi:hypothetical protein
MVEVGSFQNVRTCVRSTDCLPLSTTTSVNVTKKRSNCLASLKKTKIRINDVTDPDEDEMILG